jgi:hypothetical protein
LSGLLHARRLTAVVLAWRWQVMWNVGGEQLDAALVRHLVEDFKRRNGGLDLSHDYLALERLYDAAEAAKVTPPSERRPAGAAVIDRS